MVSQFLYSASVILENDLQANLFASIELQQKVPTIEVYCITRIAAATNELIKERPLSCRNIKNRIKASSGEKLKCHTMQCGHYMLLIICSVASK
jgi:hypothetical protein